MYVLVESRDGDDIHFWYERGDLRIAGTYRDGEIWLDEDIELTKDKRRELIAGIEAWLEPI